MPDYSIAMQGQPVNIKSPAQAVQEAAQAKNAMLRNRAIGQEMQDREALNQAYRDAGGNINAMVDDPRLGFDASMQIKGMQAEQTRAQAQAKQADIDTQFKMYEIGSLILGSAKNQKEWSEGVSQLRSMFNHPATAGLPDQYDPAVQRQIVERGYSLRDKIAMQRDEAKYQHQEMLQNMRHQQTLAAISARGDGGSGEARYNTIYDTQGKAFFVNPKDPTAPPIPIKTETGEQIAKPPVSGVQPSEDERKAAGWVNQARLASKQMGEAMAADKSASSQGILEAVLPEGIARQTLTEQRQRFNDAASSFSEAALRAATGAGINESEAKQKIYELTPRYGDKPATVKDKLARQEMYLQSLESRAGRALPKQTEPTQLSNTNAKGWILHTDAQGNKAYVSPNGEIEEVR